MKNIYTYQHSDWGDELYGWQVLVDGKLLDTYEEKEMAVAYCKYMNERTQNDI